MKPMSNLLSTKIVRILRIIKPSLGFCNTLIISNSLYFVIFDNAKTLQDHFTHRYTATNLSYRYQLNQDFNQLYQSLNNLSLIFTLKYNFFKINLLSQNQLGRILMMLKNLLHIEIIITSSSFSQPYRTLMSLPIQLFFIKIH